MRSVYKLLADVQEKNTREREKWESDKLRGVKNGAQRGINEVYEKRAKEEETKFHPQFTDKKIHL